MRMMILLLFWSFCSGPSWGMGGRRVAVDFERAGRFVFEQLQAFHSGDQERVARALDLGFRAGLSKGRAIRIYFQAFRPTDDQQIRFLSVIVDDLLEKGRIVLELSDLRFLNEQLVSLIDQRVGNDRIGELRALFLSIYPEGESADEIGNATRAYIGELDRAEERLYIQLNRHIRQAELAIEGRQGV